MDLKIYSLAYGFKNLQKMYSLAYGFSFFVISISESSSCTRVQVFLPLLVMLLLKSSVQDMQKQMANYVYKFYNCTCFYILQRLVVKSKGCCTCQGGPFLPLCGGCTESQPPLQQSPRLRLLHSLPDTLKSMERKLRSSFQKNRFPG
jgi:hypothetical protein